MNILILTDTPSLLSGSLSASVRRFPLFIIKQIGQSLARAKESHEIARSWQQLPTHTLADLPMHYLPTPSVIRRHQDHF